MAADLAVVALGLDTSALKKGEAETTAVLRTLSANFQKVEEQAKKSGDATGKAFTSGAKGTKEFQASLNSLSGSLSSLGGPVGNLSGQIEGFTSRLGSAIDEFGVAAGTITLFGTAVVTAAASLTKLTLEGSKFSDEMGDIAQGTGLSLDQVQRLSAAFRISGESVAGAERTFRTFQNAVQSAIDEPAGKAAENLKRLGIDAKAAGRDTASAFLDALSRLKELRSTTEGAAATNEVFGRNIGALTRSAEKLKEIFGLTTEQLVQYGIIARGDAVEAGLKLDDTINDLDNSWSVFKQNLAASDLGALISGSLDNFNRRLKESKSLLDVLVNGLKLINPSSIGENFIQGKALEEQRRRSNVPGAGGAIPGARSEGAFGRDPEIVRSGGGGGGSARGGGGAGGQSDAERRREEEEKRRLQEEKSRDALRTSIQKGATDRTEEWNNILRESIVANLDAIRGLEDFDKAILKTKDVLLAIPGLPAGTGEGGNIPGVVLPTPFDPNRQGLRKQIDDQFGFIFEDMVATVIAGRATVSDAFAGLMQGALDIFAQEFAIAFRTAFIQPMIQQVTNLLVDALGEIFNNVSGKGIAKLFGVIGKGIGALFGGFFAEGGTLAPGQFGVVGERGPELVYSGSRSLGITPITDTTSQVTINFMLADTGGGISKRTQDMIADGVFRGLQRSQKIKGAR